MMIKRNLERVAIAALVCGAFSVQADDHGPGPAVHFVPNSQRFWDFSKHWTSNYGPAYRDTVSSPSDFLPCTGKFALCFHSGAEPLPCKLTPDGRFASCTCTVGDGPNLVLLTAILNFAVYKETVAACGTDGSSCHTPDAAPVCRYLRHGRLIPGADVISDFLPDASTSLGSGAPVTNCDGPFAGCMTAPCTYNDDGTAECSCPVFYGHFQLAGSGQRCDLGDDLVPSASYTPALDPDVP